MDLFPEGSFHVTGRNVCRLADLCWDELHLHVLRFNSEQPDSQQQWLFYCILIIMIPMIMSIIIVLILIVYPSCSSSSFFVLFICLPLILLFFSSFSVYSSYFSCSSSYYSSSRSPAPWYISPYLFTVFCFLASSIITPPPFAALQHHIYPWRVVHRETQVFSPTYCWWKFSYQETNMLEGTLIGKHQDFHFCGGLCMLHCALPGFQDCLSKAEDVNKHRWYYHCTIGF